MTLAPQALKELLQVARSSDASDVHVAAGHPPMFRLDGALESRYQQIMSSADVDAILAECFTEEQRRLLRSRGDVTVTYDDADFGTARIHAYFTRASVSLAIRLLALEIPHLEALGLPQAAMHLAFKQQGLVIVTGPTGSGKSTVLAASIAAVNRAAAKHIITIEDPIEYRHSPQRCVISQREVDADVIDFEAGVAGALRSDPDIILLGEMRGRPAMLAAIGAAETGHVVFATMHTGTASDCIERIVGSFEGSSQAEIRTQLAETLAGVVGLRLIRRASGRGRVLAAEVLIATDAVRSAIRDAKGHHLRNIMTTSREAGMQTLEASLNDLLATEKITLEDARQACTYPAELVDVGAAS